jgi:hypothetical protein
MIRRPLVTVARRQVRSLGLDCAIRIVCSRPRRTLVDVRSAAFLDGLDQVFKCRKTGFVASPELLQQPTLVPSGEKFCGQATQPLHRSASCGQLRNAPVGLIIDQGVREPSAFVEYAALKNQLTARVKVPAVGGADMTLPVAIDDIIANARLGDAAAFDAIMADLLAKASPRVSTAYRDAMIRNVAAWLRTAMPSSKNAAIATVLSEAGRSLQAGRGITSRFPFHLLSSEERWRLRTEVLSILAFSQRWPKKRQMFSVLFSDRAI